MKLYNLKFSPQQADAMLELLKPEMTVKHGNIAKKLLTTLIKKIYKRLRNHCEDKPNHAFGMSLSEEVEIAFYVYFQVYEFNENQIFERNFIQQRLADIDRRIC